MASLILALLSSYCDRAKNRAHAFSRAHDATSALALTWSDMAPGEPGLNVTISAGSDVGAKMTISVTTAHVMSVSGRGLREMRE